MNNNTRSINNRTTIITYMFPVISIEQLDNCYLLNIDECIFNKLFIVGCLLLGIIVIIILLMSNNSRPNNISLTQNVANEPYNPKYDLTRRLLAQLLHNNGNPTQVKTYYDFPSDHQGHLNLEQKIRFVDIIRSSSLASEYRFGSTLGKVYIKNTYRYPITSAEMIGVVLRAESE